MVKVLHRSSQITTEESPEIDLMHSQDRKRAEFFARLASLPQLDGILTSVAIELIEDMLELSYPWLAKDTLIREKLLRLNPFLPDEALTAEKLRQFKETLSLVALHDVHKYSRKLITELLDQGKTDLSSIEPLQGTVLVLDREAGTITEHPKEIDPQNEMLVDLVRIIHQRFPFQRCPVCQTIFVPWRNQKYCSLKCANGSEEEREQKKTYMREYMRKRRKRLARAGSRSRVRRKAQKKA
jgi:hypothetical protein